MKAGLRKYICTPIFTAILFRIVKRWEQLKCSSMDEWVNKCGIYNGILCSPKKERNSVIYNPWYNMDEP